MALALVFRAAFIDRVAVEHFDEGVYASGYFAEHLEYRYPDLHLYAPPLLPAILRSVLYFTGGYPHAVVWVNVVAGTLLVGAVWLITRDWFGREAALVAGLLMATSEFAILYSRTMLTDTLLCLWVTLGVWAGWRAVIDASLGAGPARPASPVGRALERARWAFAAGGFAALAWWTKYNGWLPLAIAGAGTIGWGLSERPGRRASGTALLRWLTASILALLLWSPVLWMLQTRGGYAAVAANHAGYIGGFANWWDSAVRQVRAQGYIDGVVTFAGWAVLVAGIVLSRGPARIGSWLWGAFLIVLLGVWSLAGHDALLLAFLAVVGLAERYARSARKHAAANSADRGELQPSERSAFWFALAWLAGLTVAIPLYRPYPRLLLPWIVIATCCAGQGLVWVCGGWSSISKGAERRLAGLPHPWVRNALAGLILISATTVLVRSLDLRFVPWQPRTGLREAALRILDDLPAAVADRPPSQFEEVDCVLYVLGEPALYYHLASRQGRRDVKHIAQPASNLGMLRPGATARALPAFLVTGLHAHRDHPELLSSPPAGLKLIAEYPYLASDLVLLDDLPPDALEQHRDQLVRFWAIVTED